jgi:hypothetical protein
MGRLSNRPPIAPPSIAEEGANIEGFETGRASPSVASPIAPLEGLETGRINVDQLRRRRAEIAEAASPTEKISDTDQAKQEDARERAILRSKFLATQSILDALLVDAKPLLRACGIEQTNEPTMWFDFQWDVHGLVYEFASSEKSGFDTKQVTVRLNFHEGANSDRVNAVLVAEVLRPEHPSRFRRHESAEVAIAELRALGLATIVERMIVEGQSWIAEQ